MYGKNCIKKNMITDKPEDVVFEVEKWAKENPLKARQDELLKIFPHAQKDETTGAISICPATISNSHRDEEGCCNQMGVYCSECQSKFWLEEIEYS